MNEYLLNPTLTNRHKKFIFQEKLTKEIFQNLSFNGSNVEAWSSQKHLGLIMDDKLSFEVHVQNKIS